VKGLSRLEDAPCPVLAVQLEQRSSGSVTRSNRSAATGVCSDQEGS
jgi:hypothetical protein